jgi:hypothetical protein
VLDLPSARMAATRPVFGTPLVYLPRGGVVGVLFAEEGLFETMRTRLGVTLIASLPGGAYTRLG